MVEIKKKPGNKCYVSREANDKHREFLEVQGIPFAIEGHADLDLFFHLSLLIDDKGNTIYSPDDWSVSEGITGFMVASGDSPDDAILYTELQLNKSHNKKTTTDQIQKIKETPELISPRYEWTEL